jgi:hypothetical protein
MRLPATCFQLPVSSSQLKGEEGQLPGLRSQLSRTRGGVAFDFAKGKLRRTGHLGPLSSTHLESFV